MKFSGLRKSAQAYSVGDITRIENKQRISLSSHAYSTLLHDLDVFQPTGQQSGEISSELINHIFSCFCNEAESSVAEAMQKKRLRLLELLSSMQDPHAREKSIALILKEYNAELEQKRKNRCREKDHSLTFRISKDNLDYLLSDEGQKESPAYRDNIGAYFKALLEEYCEHPYVERERIYYRNPVDEIELAIQNRKLLRVVTRKQYISYVKPLELGQDTGRLYNYLVGLIASHQEGPWQIGSIRLSSISNCARQAHSGFISAEKEKEIRKAVKETGIQYLSGSDTFQKIVVEFTPVGEKMYGTILHLRPQYTNRDGRIYEFHCSFRQADNYFFKFGHHARILEPIQLAELFQRKYRNAAIKYESI